MTIGPILFGAPWALAALATLPLLFWLLRATPPAPQRKAFPGTRLLLGLKTEEQTRDRAPLWLVLLRGLALTLIILGFARPSLAPTPAEQAAGGGRTLIVIDDGWTSANFWPDVRNAAAAAAADAERVGAPVHLLLTARSVPPRDPGEALIAADARARINRLEPKPWRPDRADAAERLAQVQGNFAKIVWISDGLDDSGARAFAEALAARGPVTARLPARTASAVVSANVTPQGIEAHVRRAAGSGEAAIAAETLEGRALGAAQLRFVGQSAEARIDLPPEIAARAARVRIVGETHAGAIRLLPGGVGRPFVGLVDPGAEGQPLLSELYYVERALKPYASLQTGPAGQLIAARAQALILPDASRVTPSERGQLEPWVDHGGLLVRFAGPRLADDSSEDILPVRLRPGSRSLGAALAWEKPLGIAAFPPDSPFAGVAPPADVSVRRQVLAEPASMQEARVWARLTDNSPLVTAAPHGAGLVVLYHVGAGPDWSDLPLSGLFVEMLRRTMAFAGRGEGAGEQEIAGGPFTPTRLMDGFGALAPAPQNVEPISAEAFGLATASPETPPGLYERAGLAGAIDAARADEALAPLALPDNVARAGLGAQIERPLAGWFLGLGALMLAADLIIALMLAGRLPNFARRGAAALLLLALVGGGQAQAQPSANPTLTLRLAYVRTGEARLDRTSEQGLAALSDVLRRRTAVSPGDPIAVDLERDDLSALPFLYWPAPTTPRPLSPAAIANLDNYLNIGGLLLVDTRDAGASPGPGPRPAEAMLRGLDAPPLEQVAADHVVTRSFYLLRGFPGARLSTRLWAESPAAAQARDGVAALFIGDGDWAAAWAGQGGLNGASRQRELALRFGVNMVMVALTGNYKGDQVHVPELLRRMGRSREP